MQDKRIIFKKIIGKKFPELKKETSSQFSDRKKYTRVLDSTNKNKFTPKLFVRKMKNIKDNEKQPEIKKIN